MSLHNALLDDTALFAVVSWALASTPTLDYHLLISKDHIFLFLLLPHGRGLVLGTKMVYDKWGLPGFQG